MKKEKAGKDDITNAVVELKRLKAICELTAGSAPAAKAAPLRLKPRLLPLVVPPETPPVATLIGTLSKLLRLRLSS